MLLDSGLDSLCFAIVVAKLEDELGVDPFTASEDVLFPVTLGEFVKFYEGPLLPDLKSGPGLGEAGYSVRAEAPHSCA